MQLGAIDAASSIAVEAGEDILPILVARYRQMLWVWEMGGSADLYAVPQVGELG